MMRQVVVSGPAKGELVTKYIDLGPGAAKPTNPSRMHAAGGGGHHKGTKQPGGSGA